MSDNETTFAELVSQGRGLLDESDPTTTHSEFNYWVSAVARWLDKNQLDTGLSAEWSSLGTSPLVIGNQYYDFPESWLGFKKVVQGRLQWMAKIPQANNRKNQASKTKDSKTVLSNKVFVVHGHNEIFREKVARFLEKLKLKPIILHEQPNKGRTIIEKFVEYSDVAFAVVLLTCDDIGGQINSSTDNLKTRARQNVIFELGYFIGKLGRERVCALYEDKVEIPSDYSGVLFLPLDKNDGWQLQLAKEMKVSGLPIDLNSVI